MYRCGEEGYGKDAVNQDAQDQVQERQGGEQPGSDDERIDKSITRKRRPKSGTDKNQDMPNLAIIGCQKRTAE